MARIFLLLESNFLWFCVSIRKRNLLDSASVKYAGFEVLSSEIIINGLVQLKTVTEMAAE